MATALAINVDRVASLRSKHPEVALQAIPQLIKWVDGKAAASLVEGDVQVAAKVATLTA